MRISSGILNIIPVVLKMPVHGSRNATFGDMPIISGMLV
jgi:hypothetical protein